jgi:peptidoglycan/xylan/chitin deacetylase (PgdA/CDA1 family)
VTASVPVPSRPLVDMMETRYPGRVSPSVRNLVKQAVYDRMPGVLRRGSVERKRVALTFDDGPDHLTMEYLAVLDRLGVPATFFLVGEALAARPHLVREYIRRGHQVAGHGYDHTRFTELSRDALLEQCARTDQALGPQFTGRPSVRPVN